MTSVFGRGARGFAAAVFAAAALASAGPAEAAFPGENGKIAFVRSDVSFSGYDIWSADPDGTGLQRLTTTRSDFQPRWSADGESLAFTSARDGNPEVYLMDADGTDQARLTSFPGNDYNPTWSPDDRKIAFERFDNGIYDVYVVNPDGTGLTNLTAGQGGSEPVWSPDGRKIAFISGNNVFSMNPDGSGRLRLTSYPVPSRDSHREPGNPDFSPDGSKIAYDLVWGGGTFFAWSIVVMNADGTGAVEHHGFGQGLAEPAYSPDGSRLIFDCDGGICDLPPPSSPEFTPVPWTSRLDSGPSWGPKPGTTPPLEPQPGDYKNASHYCKALRVFLGDASFEERYSSHGACVAASK